MIEQHFNHKILTAEQVGQVIGPRPRKHKVIMCHGTFDIVHPGHIRHLIYAKNKADILVVSLTADENIEKANFRPYVPDTLRAMNLAALEMVDYVIIDRDAKPLRNIALLKPDFFAKGYEYIDGGLDPRSQEELDALNGFGGEFLFTPGDVVYSSSAIIDRAPPNLATEKLVSLLHGENLTFDDLRHTVGKLKHTSVHVVGDTIVDSYTQTALIGGNTKTPTFSVRFEEQTDYVGGAGVVAKHMRAAGADVVFTTVLGDDRWKKFAVGDLEQAGVTVNAVVDPTRPTTNKNAIIADGYRLLKIDTLDNRSISDKIVGPLTDAMSQTQCEAIVLSDFRHGIFNRGTIPRLVASIPEGVYRVADSQVASRWGNILEFQGFDLITPNEREARFALGDQDSVVRPLGRKLYEAAKCKMMILKMGERGLIAYRNLPRSDADVRAFFVVDTFARHVVDAVGAGDAMLAYATLAMVRTGNDVIAAVLGSMAAACECEYDGNLPVTPEAVLNRIDAVERSANFA
jgi:rfaE bifunctional protein kinase chain/domain